MLYITYTSRNQMKKKKFRSIKEKFSFFDKVEKPFYIREKKRIREIYF